MISVLMAAVFLSSFMCSYNEEAKKHDLLYILNTLVRANTGNKAGSNGCMFAFNDSIMFILKENIEKL